MIDDILYQIAYTLAFTYMRLLKRSAKTWIFGCDNDLSLTGMKVKVTVEMVDALESVTYAGAVNAHEA